MDGAYVDKLCRVADNEEYAIFVIFCIFIYVLVLLCDASSLLICYVYRTDIIYIRMVGMIVNGLLHLLY